MLREVVLDALRLSLPGRLAGAEPLNQIRDVRKLLLEVAVIGLEPLEHVLAVVPTMAEAAATSSVSVMHRHLPS